MLPYTLGTSECETLLSKDLIDADKLTVRKVTKIFHKSKELVSKFKKLVEPHDKHLYISLLNDYRSIILKRCSNLNIKEKDSNIKSLLANCVSAIFSNAGLNNNKWKLKQSEPSL